MQKGVGEIFALLGVLFIVGLMAAGSYYYLKSTNSLPNDLNLLTTEQNLSQDSKVTTISNADDINTLEKEIESVKVGSPSSDIQGLDEAASSI